MYKVISAAQMFLIIDVVISYYFNPGMLFSGKNLVMDLERGRPGV